jgi:acetyl-CoA acetyltransferase
MPAFITGISELYGKRMDETALQLHLNVGRAAILDAGLSPDSIDGILTNSPMHVGGTSFSSVVAEGLGLHGLRLSQVIELGGASACAMANLAARIVNEGWCQAVLVTCASTRRSSMASDKPTIERRLSTVNDDYEASTSPTVPALYALAAARHMHLYGSTPAEFAHVSVEARANAARTEHAVMRKPITVDDVLTSKLIASPLRMLDCCIYTDYAGAMVVVKAPHQARGKHMPIRVMGGGEGHTHAFITTSPDILTTGASLSGATAFAQAGMSPANVDFVQLYDCFSVAVILELEDLGFCKRGEGAAFAASGALKLDGSLPFNTNGGLLSFHSGGVYHVTEAVQQLRNEAEGRQVEDAGICLVHGNGGVYSHHATVILAREDAL